MRQCNGEPANGGSLRRWFGNNGIAGNQGRSDLTQENRQREVPRGNRNPHAPAFMAQDITFTRWAGQCNRDQVGARARGVIATKINRLADFGKRIGNRFARLLHRNGHQLAAVFLQ